jgi:hypothetical protein
MGKKLPVSETPNVELPVGEDDVSSHGIGKRGHGAGRLSGVRIRVHADTREILAEARLEKCARGGVERLARRAQNLVHNRWDQVRRRRTRRPSLQSLILFALLTFSADGVLPTGTLPLQHAARRWRQHRRGGLLRQSNGASTHFGLPIPP